MRYHGQRREELDRMRHEALDLLKPICMALMQEFSPSASRNLQNALNKVDKHVIQEILQYLLFPIQNALHQKSISELELSHACLTLDAILHKACVDKMQMFFDLFNPLVRLLSSPENPSQVCTKSEEVKAAIVTSIASLFKSSNDSVLNDVYTLKFLPAVGQVVSLVLSLAELERSRNLQAMSLDCLMVVLQTDTKYGDSHELELGDFLTFCLPGITMATTRIITGDQKQGHAVIKKAMMTWSRLVHLTLSDSLLEKSQKRLEQRNHNNGSSANSERLFALKVERNADWVKNSANKVKLLLEKICGCNLHTNWRVRSSLVDILEDILMTCSRSLQTCVPKVLDCLVALITDEYGNVASKANSTLQAFAAAQRGLDGERTLREILEENLHSFVTSLPRRIRMSDEEEKPVLIRLLKGYILLLGSDITSVINSTPHLSRLSLALVQSLEMETNDLKIVEERQTLLDYEADTFYTKEPCHVWKPKRYFKHFREDSVLAELLSVCQLLGKYGDLLTLVHHFLDLYHQSSNYTLASILVINEIVLGAGKTGNEGDKDVPPITTTDSSVLNDVISMLLDEYTTQENLRRIDFTQENATPTVPSGKSLTSSLAVWKPSGSSSKATETIASHNTAILLHCLFMEGVGKFAQILGENFHQHMMETLYGLVENLGHENMHISSTAYLTLTQICSACGYRCVDHLIQANADYLLNSVSLRLRHLEHNRRTPRVLSVMLRYCSQDLLPLIDHSITEILDSLDDHYSDHLVLFMPVLLELTTAIGRWFPCLPQKVETQPSVRIPAPTSKEVDPGSIILFVEEFALQRKIMDGEFTDEEVLPQVPHTERRMEDIEGDMQRLVEEKNEERRKEAEGEEEEDKETKSCPKHIQVVKDVFQRIKNLLSSHDARVRVQALDIVAQGCLDLANHERELLPEIHQLWPGFYPRFHSDDKFVIIKALHTLKVMADVSGSFIQQRVLKDVIPGLVHFMDKQEKISSGSHSAYLHTNNFKLQLCLLNISGPLAHTMALTGAGLETLATMCLPYLCDLQPMELQKACVETFSHFISLEADAMWLLLCQTHCPVDLHPPSHRFHPLPSFHEAQKTNNYSRNITQIFETSFSS